MAFPSFLRLPLELQDLVWELSIPDSTPCTAHFTLLLPMVDAIEDVPSLRRSRAPITGFEPYPGFSRFTALRTLLQTTSRSRAVSLRHADTFTPPPSATLRERPFYGAQPFLPELRINVATDLIILEDDWYSEVRPLPESSIRQLLSSDPLRYIAISNRNGHSGIHRLLSAYEHLKVLYILVEPSLFGPTEDITTYRQGQNRPGGFWFGRREYFEITPEIAELSGSRKVLDLHERFLEESDAIVGKKYEEPQMVRLMSWRDV